MRLVQVAKILGLSGQELRRELAQVNFGVRPTDREVPDTLAKGIIRFVAGKRGIAVDVENLGELAAEEPEEKEQAPVAPPVVEAAPSVPAKAEPTVRQIPVSAPAPVSAAGLKVLRKLTLEDVPREAIARQEKQLKSESKEQREERAREERLARVARSAKDAATSRDQQQIKRKKEGVVLLPDLITVKELAEKTGIQVPQLIQVLMKNGVMATVTQSIDFDTAMIVAGELGVTVQRETRSATAEELLSRNLQELLKDDPEHLVPRPPIVVVMGHVDHGKTTLLDAIRSSDVAAHEAGGITQHIGAYQVEHTSSIVSGGSRTITFLDTPGHEAFTAMRARGAQVTDIVILVVSADEGVKATTVEAIDHAKEANVPIIVAITKIDRERADPERVKGEVAAHGLQPEDWGGKVPVVLCSGVTKQGIPDLLDHILLIAEERTLRANPLRSAIATVIESHLDSSLGPLVTVLVNTGTLRVGDCCVCGQTIGRVKALIDAHGARMQAVEPSGAARMSGLEAVPAVGDILQVVVSEKEARNLQEAISDQAGAGQKRSFADLVARLSEGKLKQLKVVLKADAQGSLEAIEQALDRLATGEVTAKVIHGAVGAVSESDVMMASASEAVVLAFHVPVAADVRRTAEREGVQVRQHEILYELLDEVDLLLKGLIEPVEEESVIGHLQVRGIFFREKGEQIIGGKVTDGIVKRVPFRLQREEKTVGEGRILSLKHVDRDIKEAKEGQECGMKVEFAGDILEGDVLEAFMRELRKKE